ncbi:MAG: helix-turn-helix domain-containing protein [Thermoflexales bacterium]|nr:helix-turn-helix domain-containing protein [Thermoflexales bacterium]
MAKSEQLSDWITTAQAADLLKVTPRMVRKLIKQKALEANKVTERLWLVSRASVASYLARKSERKLKDKAIE